jgi:hypothetical protein
MSACASLAACAGQADVGAQLALEFQQQALGGLLADAGHLHEPAGSCVVTACAELAHAHAAEHPSAVRGPTPVILMSWRKAARSSALPKP